MKKISMYMFLICFMCHISAQQTITLWNFDDSNTEPVTGVGIFVPIGGSALSGYPTGNPASGKGYNTNAYPAKLNANKTAGVEIKASTKGYRDITLSFDHRSSNTGANTQVVLISTDEGVSFKTIDSLKILAGDMWYSRDIDLTRLIESYNHENLIIRIVSAFEDSLGYKASNPTSNYSSNGTWRFDNIALKGKSIQADKPTLSIALSSDTASESAESRLTMIFKLSEPLGSDFKAVLHIGGININQDDYNLPNGDTVLLLAGSTADTLYIDIKDDTLKEGTELMNLRFEAVDTNITPLAYANTIYIWDNDQPANKISQVQGIGFTSPIVNTYVTLEAVVTYSSQGAGKLGGFFMQEEDADIDADPQTSEGIWVRSLTPVSIGDKVRMFGKVAETFGLTEIVDSKVSILDTGHHLPLITHVSLPQLSLEPFEGMYVSITSRMTVTESYNLARYGELMLSARGRLFNTTNLIDPNDTEPHGTTYEGTDNVAAVHTYRELMKQRRIILDDGLSVEQPNPIPYLDHNHTIRLGSYADSIVGILSYDFGNYRIQPKRPINWTYMPRPEVPVISNANVTIAGFNVENLFNGENGSYAGSRGATSDAEFKRQIAKVSRAISALKADIVGIVEIENDGFDNNSAIQTLVDSINMLSNDYNYEVVVSPSKHQNLYNKGWLGNDAIKVGFIYNSLTVSPVGDYLVDDDTLLYDRIPVAQQFKLKQTNASFTAVINHFKSKGCSNASGKNLDQDDGQSCYNERRKLQAEGISNFVNKIIEVTNEEDVLILGDLNAYGQEDPIDLLRSKGFVDLVTHDSAYTYVFMGESGTLDHALATPTLAAQLKGTKVWQINSDEPQMLNYSILDRASYKPKAIDFYQNTPFRSSDHDPVLVGFDLLPDLVTKSEDASFGKIKIYPNPIKGRLSMEIPESYVGKNFEIRTADGRQVYEGMLALQHNDIDLDHFDKGLYIIHINNQYFRIVKE